MTPEAWWSRLRAAALVGTGRRAVPPSTSLGVAERNEPPEQRALDGAALGAMLHRAGQLPDRGEQVVPAPEDRLPAAPARALQVLDLVLDQPPAGMGNTEILLRAWLAACADSGHRVPHTRLSVLLERGERSSALRAPLRAVIDERGRWLAARNPAWAWALVRAEDVVRRDHEDVDADAWALLPDTERATALQRVRYRDPARGRELLLGTWPKDPAKVRAAHLEALAIGLSADDEHVLEAALDDRAASVRAVAVDLLDGLPGSARAARMAGRLRPLLRTSGLLGRTLEVALPDDPDPDGVRDGLGKPPPGRSSRGWWLERIVAGAPLDVWGDNPDKVVRKVDADDALKGLRRAAVRRHDVAWAEALLPRHPDPELVQVLPATRREQVVLSLLGQTDRPQLGRLLAAVPGPWSRELSEAVVTDLAGRKHPYGSLEDLPLSRLHPLARSRLERWLARIPDKSPVDKALRRSVRNLVQLHSLRDTISEAFR